MAHPLHWLNAHMGRCCYPTGTCEDHHDPLVSEHPWPVDVTPLEVLIGPSDAHDAPPGWQCYLVGCWCKSPSEPKRYERR